MWTNILALSVHIDSRLSVEQTFKLNRVQVVLRVGQIKTAKKLMMPKIY
jgi:hypothetical protein